MEGPCESWLGMAQGEELALLGGMRCFYLSCHFQVYNMSDLCTYTDNALICIATEFSIATVVLSTRLMSRMKIWSPTDMLSLPGTAPLSNNSSNPSRDDQGFSFSHSLILSSDFPPSELEHCGTPDEWTWALEEASRGSGPHVRSTGGCG